MKVWTMVVVVIGFLVVVGLLVFNLSKRGADTADSAATIGYGSIWVEDDTRSEYMFTDDGGNDFVVDFIAGTISRGGIVKPITGDGRDALSLSAKDVMQELEVDDR